MKACQGHAENSRATVAGVDIIPVMRGKKSWWKSKTIQGLGVAGLPVVLRLLKIELGAEQTRELVEGTMSTIGLLYAGYGRVSATEQLGK